MTTKSTAFAVDAPAASYKWYVLALGALTFTLVVAIPMMSLPVLFEEIRVELNLSLVQVGWIWGMGSFMSIVMGLVGGTLGDRFGPKNMLTVVCLLVGITGAARALANDFFSLAATMFLLGLFLPAIPMNVHKTCALWFPGRQLGMANGVVSVGMAFGFMLGSLLAATVFSPLVGGWRNLFMIYGAVAVLVSMFWLFSKPIVEDDDAAAARKKSSLPEALSHVGSIRNVWLFALATMGISGCVNGALGYLPLYLREAGWLPATADSAAASFHAASMLAAIPIALLSDRLRMRKGILMIAAGMICIGVGLLGFVQGPLIWLAILTAGVVRDGFMAITMTSIMEVRGVGARFAGTATGLSMVFMGIANVVSPPLGNSLERFGASTPFLLWSAMALAGLLVYTLIRRPTESA
ncbi:MAG: MFS transporter [Caldilineaceae bacterium]